MRNISPSTLELIQNKTGLQPINFIAIQWVDFGDIYYYSDRRIDGTNFIPVILELGNIENIVKVSDNSRSQSVSIKLDDTSGELKNIINQIDIHKRQVNIYQWFVRDSSQIIPQSDAFIIFQGEINSPIIWREGDRTLSFEVVEKVEDQEIGFSVEEGQFDFVPEQFWGKPFPLGFGANVRVPALQIMSAPVGITRHPIGFADPSLKPKINQNAEKIKGLQEAQWLDLLYAGECAFIAFLLEDDIKKLEQYRDGAISWNQYRAQALTQEKLQTAIPSSNFDGQVNTGGTYTPPGVASLPNVSDPPIDSFRPDYTPPANTSSNLIDFASTGVDTSSGAVGETEGPEIDIAAIDSAISDLSSQASEARGLQKTFQNKAAQEGAQAAQIIGDNLKLGEHLEHQEDVGQITSVIDGQKFPRGIIKVKINEAEMIGSFAGDVFNPDKSSIILNPNDKRDPNRKPTIDENIEKGTFTVINPGATVKLISEYPIYFIVNLLPSQVTEVVAKRSAGGGQAVLVPLPPSYYTVSQKVFGIYNCTIITLHRALSTYDEGWEDQIYVSFISSIGPNTIDILIWLIITYTNHAFDAAEFLYVKAKLAQFPSNFVLFDRKNILTILEELAFQARIGLWLDNGIFRIKYLPEESLPVDTITQSDIEFGSLEVQHSETEDLVTKFVGKYKFHYEDKDPNLCVMRYNINKYGLITKEYDYYAYNISSCVYLSIAYWLIRKANTWKRIKFKTPLHKLNLETFDTILLDFGDNDYISFGPVLGIIESCKYDSDNWSIEFEVWVPIRIGEMFPYFFAFPANVSPFFYFPTNEEIADGSVGSHPNTDVSGVLPGADRNFGETVTIQIPDDMPRVKGQGNRPRDFGPSNVSDNRVGGPFVDTSTQSNVGSVESSISNAQPYIYRNYAQLPDPSKPPFANVVTPDPDTREGTSVPCQILSGTGNTYQAQIYTRKTGKKGKTITVTILQIDPTETIPTGSWLVATRLNSRYIAQPPIWFEG